MMGKERQLEGAFDQWQAAVKEPVPDEPSWQARVRIGEQLDRFLQESIRSGRVVRLVVTSDVVNTGAITRGDVSRLAESVDGGHEFRLVSSNGLGVRIQGGTTLVVRDRRRPIGHFVPREIVSLSLLDTD